MTIHENQPYEDRINHDNPSDGYSPFTAFQDLELEMDDLGYSQEVLDSLLSIGQDEEDQFSSSEFWTIMAVAAKDKVLDMQNKGFSLGEISVFLFMSSLPNAIRIEEKLKNSRTRDEKIQLCEINGYLRNIIKSYPKTTQENMINNSLTVMTPQIRNLNSKVVSHTNFQKKNLEAKNKVSKTFETMLQGAKNEVWLEQILQNSNIRYRETTPTEDLQGKDFIIYDVDGKEVAIDVKSSITQLIAELPHGATLDDQMYVELVNHRDGSRKLMVVPYVFPSDIPTQRNPEGRVEHKILIPEQHLTRISQKMHEDVFSFAETIA